MKIKSLKIDESLILTLFKFAVSDDIINGHERVVPYHSGIYPNFVVVPLLQVALQII